MQNEIVEIVAQEGDRVLVPLPMKGFPPGFQLNPGARVLLEWVGGEFVVTPVVREQLVRAVGADRFEIDGEEHELQDATHRGELGDASHHRVTIIDRGSSDGPHQVVAISAHERDY